MIEKATAAAGARWVMDYNSTSRRPMAPCASWEDRTSVTAASCRRDPVLLHRWGNPVRLIAVLVLPEKLGLRYQSPVVVLANLLALPVQTRTARFGHEFGA
jgi:hypothetical protein